MRPLPSLAALLALVALASCGVEGPPRPPDVDPDEESILEDIDGDNVVGVQLDTDGGVRFGGRITIGANIR